MPLGLYVADDRIDIPDEPEYEGIGLADPVTTPSRLKETCRMSNNNDSCPKECETASRKGQDHYPDPCQRPNPLGDSSSSLHPTNEESDSDDVGDARPQLLK